MKTKLLTILFLFLLFSVASKSQDTAKKLPIIDGAASYLPKPDYPAAARKFCADGKVEVEVLIGTTGHVLTAQGISGDEVLFEAAVSAAKQAKFRQIADGEPIQTRGIVVYNFDSLSGCIKLGVVNEKARSIPKPVFPRECSCSGTVSVLVVIDESGNVLSARAISGHLLLRNAAERSALGAKFFPTLINPGPLRVKAMLIYAFDSTGKIKY